MISLKRIGKYIHFKKMSSTLLVEKKKSQSNLFFWNLKSCNIWSAELFIFFIAKLNKHCFWENVYPN